MPTVPLTKDEIKGLLNAWQEILGIRTLRELQSVSASIITALGLTREVVKCALSILRRRHDAQVNLIGVLCATRFKAMFQGVVIPTFCPNTYRGGSCNAEDTFAHMLTCYNLKYEGQKGLEALDFLLEMAKRAIPTFRVRGGLDMSTSKC